MSISNMPTGVGFFDATCPTCNRRYGWRGTLADKPKCPNQSCGSHKHPKDGRKKSRGKLVQLSRSDGTDGTVR